MRGLIDVRPDERRNTFAAFATLLAITTGHTLLETARDALFLTKVSSAELPWMYLVIVVLALGLVRVRTADNKGVIVSVILAGAGLTAGFWALLGDRGSRPWVLYGLYVWSGLFASWVIVQFWTLLGRVHTMTQAKRLYGFIGAGAVLGGVLGAFLARAALAFIPPRSILLASAALFVAAVPPVLALRLPEAPVTAPGHVRDDRARATLTGASLLWESSFARRGLGIALLSTVTVTLVDFLFKARISEAYTNAQELGARISTFYAVTNTLALAAQVIVGPWIFRAVGVQRALFLFPLLLFGGACGVLATGGALAPSVLLKGIDGTLRYSVQRTSMELLLVPIPDWTRDRIKPIVELAGTRGGQALGSITILVLLMLGASGTSVLAAFVVALSVFWIANVVTIRRHYLDVFRETLRSGGLSGDAQLPELDLGALEMLFAGLNSSRDAEVLASLELLAEQHRERLIPALILYHPSREVVLRALQLFALRGTVDFVPIADRLNSHPDPEVASAALRARTAVAPDRKLLESRLADTCTEVSATALVALMARGWIDPVEADRRLAEVLARRSWLTAVELARAIRDIAGDERTTPSARARFDALLIRLVREAGSVRDVAYAPMALSDRSVSDVAAESLPLLATPSPAQFGMVEMAVDARVCLEVARAMATRKSPTFLPVLVQMLNRHELRAASRATIALIPGALEFVDDAMRRHDLAREIRVHLPRTMALLDPARATPKLMAHLLSEKDGAVRYKVLRALVKLRRENPKLPVDEGVLGRVLEYTLDHAEELWRWGVSLAAGNDAAPTSMSDPALAAHLLLVDLVRDKERHALHRIFLLLELREGSDFEDIERGLRSSDPKTRASSLELLENVVRPPFRARVLALVGERDSTQPQGYEETLRAMVESGGKTLRTFAEHRAMELGLDLGSGAGDRSSIESLGVRRASDRMSEPRAARHRFARARELLISDVPSLESERTRRAPA